MNRIQFFVLTGLSGLVVLLLAAQILLLRVTASEQIRVSQAQQQITQGQASQAILKQLAVRIYQDSTKYGGDQGLKDLMTRQQISYTPPGASTESNNAETTPASTPATH